MIPVSLSGGVQPGARTGTSVNGRPVVVWRGQDGAARAWADQCPPGDAAELRLRPGQRGRLQLPRVVVQCRRGRAGRPFVVVAKADRSAPPEIRRKRSDGRDDKYIFVRRVEKTEGIVIMGPSEHN
jgi:hypothetical protein